jgi:hypothetical protein
MCLLKIALLFIIVILCCFILWFVFSCFILKIIKSRIDIKDILFYDYNKKTKNFLNVYGDNSISDIYLVRQPNSKIMSVLLNICKFYNYNEIKKYIPYHTQLIFVIKHKDKQKKIILVEKNTSININDNFHISNDQEFKHINIKNKYTLNSVLKTTQDRIGIYRFFNWRLCHNNNRKFTKECLITVNKYNKDTRKYIFSDTPIKPSEITMNVLNCICNVSNICDKYI